MRPRIAIAALLLCAPNIGCVMFEVGVSNPVAGLTTVAVAPFFNLSEEPTVDGRRFAQAYFTELQKTPGFQVVPVGIVEQALHDHQMELNSPEEALKLAEILSVDAVVIGAVTDYSPYYPPRIGLQVSWYSPYEWQFVPGLPIEESERKSILKAYRVSRRPLKKSKCPPGEPCLETGMPTISVRGQSNSLSSSEVVSIWDQLRGRAVQPPDPAIRPAGAETFGEIPQTPVPVVDAMSTAPIPAFDPRKPLMSYTRMLDGADPKLTARLRDYRELSGDLRSGGWEAYLYRSEDFIRFSAHVMVVEMLQLHGGESRRRMVLKLRKQG